jgi:8-hydroxy-5-deazaflavin:NADPH oxidoreductase
MRDVESGRRRPAPWTTASRRNNPSRPRVTDPVTTIGFIGSGHIGSTVARLAVAAGYDVVMSNSRGPGSLTGVVTELGDHARAGTPEEAADAGDIVVVSIPLRAHREVPVAPLAGTTVIDTNNYYPQRDGSFPELDDESTTTSELLQRHLPSSRVVKAFNNIYFRALGSLNRPAGAEDRSALPIAGDDADAKTAVTAFLDRLGYDAVDVGPLAEGWRYQRDTPAYAVIYAGPDGWADPRPANADTLLDALAKAVRYRDMAS